jgi:hypothetical protein
MFWERTANAQNKHKQMTYILLSIFISVLLKIKYGIYAKVRNYSGKAARTKQGEPLLLNLLFNYYFLIFYTPQCDVSTMLMLIPHPPLAGFICRAPFIFWGRS